MAYSTYNTPAARTQQQPKKKMSILENTALLEQLADRRQPLPASPESLLEQLKAGLVAVYELRYGGF